MQTFVISKATNMPSTDVIIIEPTTPIILDDILGSERLLSLSSDADVVELMAVCTMRKAIISSCVILMKERFSLHWHAIMYIRGGGALVVMVPVNESNKNTNQKAVWSVVHIILSRAQSIYYVLVWPFNYTCILCRYLCETTYIHLTGLNCMTSISKRKQTQSK